MPKKFHLTSTVPDELSGKRLDLVLAILFPDYSRARLQTWIKENNVWVDDKHLRQRDKVHAGQLIRIEAELTENIAWEGQDIPINIVYEDEDIIVINKQPGLVVHPAPGNRDNTLVNALLHHAPSLAAIPRAGVIHRLDKNTTGLLVITKTLESHHTMVSRMKNREITREYKAIVNGVLTAGGTVDAPIGRHPSMRTKMAVTNHGKTARTHYKIIQRFQAHTFLQIALETGRTHQIRVHMAYIHHPIVGDKTYGAKLCLPPSPSENLRQTLENFDRQALHAFRLAFLHPKTNTPCEFTAQLPDDMQNLLKLL